MKIVTKLIASVLLSIITIGSLSAQDTGRLNVNGSVGISILLNANIEYRISESSEMSSYIALGGGKIASFSTIPHLDLTHVFLRGRSNNKFEFGYGLTLFEPTNDQHLYVNFRLGYRRLSFNNNSFFRTGLSLAEGLYIGWGFNL